MATISSYTNDNAITVKGLWDEFGSKSSIYNSNYTDYGEWSVYSSSSTIKIGSPTLTSLGIPNDAIIYNVKATVRGAIYKNSGASDFTSVERYIDINSNKYGLLSGSDGTTNDTTKVFDTGDIDIKKSDISNDRLYFLYSTICKSGQSSKYLKVYWVYWEITYEDAGKKYCAKLGDNEIKNIYLGNTEVQTVYKTNEQ